MEWPRRVDTASSRYACVLAVALLCAAPLVLDKYGLSLLIQIGATVFRHDGNASTHTNRCNFCLVMPGLVLA